DYVAASAQTTFTISPKGLTVTATGVDKVYDSTTLAQVNLASTGVLVGDQVSFSYTTAAFADRNAGNGKVVNVNGISLSGSDAGNYTANSTATTTANIQKANAAITVTGYSVTYDSNAHTATGSVSGVGSDGALSGLDLSGTTHTHAGTYTDTWTFTDVTGNYNNASGSVNDPIGKANPSITFTPYT